MKLSEQQLAETFQHSKDTTVGSVIYDLNNSTKASEKRMKDVEAIANNSTLSASHQIIHQMKPWSHAVAKELQKINQPHFFSKISAWLQPLVATAAVFTAVYFISPFNNQEIKQTIIQVSKITSIQPQKQDRIMYSSSFEKSSHIQKDNHTNKKPDVIAKFDFS